MDKIVEKLKALAKLQYVDSKLDKIVTLRGSLPDEVDELEFEIQGQEAKKAKIQEDIREIEGEITKRKAGIKDFAAQIRKYEEQLTTVKNNREYEALTKEVEFANLEILTSEKKIKQMEDQIAVRQGLLEETQSQIDDRSQDLNSKRKELEEIVRETELEEQRLRSLSGEAQSFVDDRILGAYRKIRKNMRNGLAVVATDREACGGCFAIIPPQMQLELRQKKKLLICENCGRMLVDHSFFTELLEEVGEQVSA
jgi:predicted  nucleic acid-binding Zn-ribbon protein